MIKSNFSPRFLITNQLRLLPHPYSVQHLWVSSHFHSLPLNQSCLQVLQVALIFFVKTNNFAITLVISFWPLTKFSSIDVSSLVIFCISSQLHSIPSRQTSISLILNCPKLFDLTIAPCFFQKPHPLFKHTIQDQHKYHQI